MVFPVSNWTILGLFNFVAPKVFFAIVCGGLIGLERELKNKPAGMKTNILICLGSTLFTSVSLLMATSLSDTGHVGDPARIAAQIIPGVGFLGGGTIIQSRGTILGLTTAATIWVVAGIGIFIGIGRPDIAVISSVTVILALVMTNFFEDRILGRAISFACEVACDDPNGKVRFAINQALTHNHLILDDFEISSRDHLSVLSFKYSGHRNQNKRFILELWGLPGIKEVRQV